eukprot:g8726.t1
MRRLSIMKNKHCLNLSTLLNITRCIWTRALATRGGASAAVASKTKKKSKKEEAKKPKRFSGYSLFLRDNLKNYQEAGSTFVEASKAAAKKWETTPAQLRQKYNDEAMKLNESYKPPPVEKAPPTAYNAFFKSVYPGVKQKYPDAKFAQQTKIIGEMWKRLDADEKTKRQQIAAQAIREFKEKQTK